jgi:carboxyl-terminal processing protease
LSEAINLAGLFVSRGPVVQVRNSQGEIQVDDDDIDQVAYAGPLAVLVDRFSASASEIVAGALQSYGRAIVIGDSSTHGKGTVQNLFDMKSISQALADSPDKTGAAKITIQKFYLPDGASTQLRGVVSDIVLPSIDDYLPIGESDLPHALVWDRIPSAQFNGAPLDSKILEVLRRKSEARQSQLEEFSYLNRQLDFFKARQEQKIVSLNLAERRKEELEDDAFTKQMNAERTKLAKNDFPLTEFRLAPPTPAALKAPPKKDDASPDGDDDELSTDQDESYPKADVHLREALRVLNDAIDLGSNHEYWVSNHAPITAAVKG